MRKIWIQLVKLWGWQFEIPDLKDRPEIAHCVVAVAPHTAFVDYIVGAAVLFAAGVKPKIFVKKEFFNFFTRPLLLRLGLVPVDRGNRHNGLVEKAVKLLRSEDCELRENLLREVRHYNTTADDMQTLGPGSGVVAECMGAHVDLQAKPARRGLMIYLI